jgi:hypothetical protein
MHAQRRRTPILIPALMSLLLVAAACGDPDATATETTVDRPTDATVALEDSAVEPAAKLRQAAQRSAEFDTVTFEMVMSADGEPMSRIVSQSSADGSRARMTMDMPGVGEVQVLVVDGTYYYAFPGLPDGIEWASMSAAELTEISGIDPSAAGAQDPTKAFEALSAVSDEVETVGEEQIDGVDTTHYRFTADVSGLFDQAVASGTLGGQAAETVEAFDGDTVMDAWIDDEGLIRRLTYELSLDPAVAGDDLPGTFSYELTFSDYGAPVDVAAPPAEQTMSMQEMMGSAGSMFGS